MVDHDAAALLRCHVGRRSHHGAGLGDVDRRRRVHGELRDPEVEQLDPLAARDLRIGDQEHVVRLEIAMHDALGVRGAQRTGDLAGDREHGGPAERRPRRAPRQGIALEVLHDDERGALGGPAEVVDLDDPRVADRGGRARLVEEPRHDVLLLRQLGEQDLDRRRPAEQRMLAGVDRTHTAPADHAGHAVLPDHRAAHREPDSTAAIRGHMHDLTLSMSRWLRRNSRMIDAASSIAPCRRLRHASAAALRAVIEATRVAIRWRRAPASATRSRRTPRSRRR